MTAENGSPWAQAPTFLGMPQFPDAPRSALASRQLRANLGHATAVIRTKPLAAVSELEDWEQFGSRDLAAPAPESFRAWWKQVRRPGTRRCPGHPYGARIRCTREGEAAADATKGRPGEATHWKTEA